MVNADTESVRFGMSNLINKYFDNFIKKDSICCVNFDSEIDINLFCVLRTAYLLS